MEGDTWLCSGREGRESLGSTPWFWCSFLPWASPTEHLLSPSRSQHFPVSPAFPLNHLWCLGTGSCFYLLLPPHPDAGKDWGQEEKGLTEDEMVGWHHWLHEREFEQTPEDGEGQGSLACCSPWGRKESDMTDWLNNNAPHRAGLLLSPQPSLPSRLTWIVFQEASVTNLNWSLLSPRHLQCKLTTQDVGCCLIVSLLCG